MLGQHYSSKFPDEVRSVCQCSIAPPLQEAATLFNGHEPPRSESFFLSPSGKATESSGLDPLRHPEAPPTLSRSLHIEVSLMPLIPLFFHIKLIWFYSMHHSLIYLSVYQLWGLRCSQGDACLIPIYCILIYCIL